MRLTPTGFALLGLGVVLASAPLWPGTVLPVVVVTPLGASLLAAVGIAAGWPVLGLRRWQAAWRLPPTVMAREEVAVAALLTGPGALPPVRLLAWEPNRRRLQEVGRLGGQDAPRLRPAWALRFPRRGLATLPPLELVTRLPFGLLEHRHVAGTGAEVLVLPAPGRLHRRARERLARHRSEGGQRVRADGDDLAHLRPYRPGDHPHTIHWRATARAGRLVVAERQEAGSLVLHVVLDTRAQRLEDRVTLAATVVDLAGASGLSVVLHLPSGPVGGPREHLLEALAMVGAGDPPVDLPVGAVLLSDVLPEPDGGLLLGSDDLARGGTP
jgi:uncharacterized protein (DUF58 family)